jgi:putative transposase
MAKKVVKFDPELLDALLAGADPKTVLSSRGLFGDLKKALAERMLNAELDHHLSRPEEEVSGNHRNGNSSKTVLADDEKLQLDIPRDRQGRFEPALIGKYQRRLPGFDAKVIAMYARGMTTREIQATLLELYGLTVSPELISTITDVVLEEVHQWQMRPLESVYAFVFFDAIRVKIRDEGSVKNKAVYLAIGYRCSGHKEILGIWIEQTEGAKFWLRVMNELKSRGLDDILIAVIDGLKGFPEAIEAVFPETRIQTCIVHLLRYSLQFASWKDRKALARALKPLYQSQTSDQAREELHAFATGPWGQKFPMIVDSWKRNWEQ